MRSMTDAPIAPFGVRDPIRRTAEHYIQNVMLTEDIVYDLPKDALRPIATYLNELARKMKLHAAELEERDRTYKKAEAAVAKAVATGRLVHGQVRRGVDVEGAITAIAVQEGVPMGAIVDDDPFDPRGRIARMTRNRDIVRRAALGWTHEEIGEHAGMSETTSKGPRARRG